MSSEAASRNYPGSQEWRNCPPEPGIEEDQTYTEEKRGHSRRHGPEGQKHEATMKGTCRRPWGTGRMGARMEGEDVRTDWQLTA